MHFRIMEALRSQTCQQSEISSSAHLVTLWCNTLLKLQKHSVHTQHAWSEFTERVAFLLKKKEKENIGFDKK